MSYRRGNGRNRVTMNLEAGDKQPPARTAHNRCGERNAPLRLETPVCRSPDGQGQDPAPTPARMFTPVPEPAPGLLLAYHPIPVPVPGAGHHRLGKSLPISLVALDPLFPGSGGLIADRYTAASCALPASGLNQYQGGMCNSQVLKTTERTPHHLISPIDLNRVATDNAAWRYVHFTLVSV